MDLEGGNLGMNIESEYRKGRGILNKTKKDHEIRPFA
jgi:hypothetical protein